MARGCAIQKRYPAEQKIQGAGVMLESRLPVMLSPRVLRDEARKKVAKAIRQGDLPKASAFRCHDCLEPATDYDHRDYTKPLKVEPVCKACNIRRGSGFPPIDGEDQEVDWCDMDRNRTSTRKGPPWSIRLKPQINSALTRMALADDVSKSEWIARAIQRAAIRRGVWK